MPTVSGGTCSEVAGVDAGLGGEGAFADIGGMAIGRAVEHLVEPMRSVGERPELVVGHADFEAIGEFGLELEGGND